MIRKVEEAKVIKLMLMKQRIEESDEGAGEENA